VPGDRFDGGDAEPAARAAGPGLLVAQGAALGGAVPDAGDAGREPGAGERAALRAVLDPAASGLRDRAARAAAAADRAPAGAAGSLLLPDESGPVHRL